MDLLSIVLYGVVVAAAMAQRYSNYEYEDSHYKSGDSRSCYMFDYENKLLEKLALLDNSTVFLLNRIEKLERQKQTPAIVSGHVRLSKSMPLNGSERVMYDVEISNIGSAYDLKEGHFLAPTRGIYLIHVQMCLGHIKQWMDLNIIKDGAVIGRVYAGDTEYHSCGSEMLNILLEKGNKVWVVREDGQSTSLNQDHGWNSFNAILLNEL